MGRMPSTIKFSLLVPALHTQPGPVLRAFPASVPSPRLPHSLSTCTLSGPRFPVSRRCSGTRRERVKARGGAWPGRGGGKRGWDPREGARGLGGGGERAHRRPSKWPAAGPGGGGAVWGFPHPHPESKPRRSPGAPASRRKCSVTPVSALIPPRASGLGEPPDSAWDTGASSSRTAGRSPRASSEGPPPRPHNFPLFTWDRRSDLRTYTRAVVGRAPHRGARPPGRGDLSLCTPAASLGWRLRLSDGSPLQDLTSWISDLRGARCTRVWKSGGSPPPQTPS